MHVVLNSSKKCYSEPLIRHQSEFFGEDVAGVKVARLDSEYQLLESAINSLPEITSRTRFFNKIRLSIVGRWPQLRHQEQRLCVLLNLFVYTEHLYVARCKLWNTERWHVRYWHLTKLVALKKLIKIYEVKKFGFWNRGSLAIRRYR